MAVAKFVVAGGDYMGVWEETPKMSIALHRNGSYDDMIARVIEADELTCEPNDLVISYQMNERGKIHPTFIKNDRHVSLYMLDIGIDGSKPTLRINVNARPPIEPINLFNSDNDSIGNEKLGDHSKESLGDNSNESLGDHSMNIHDDPTNGQKELGSQSNHLFFDEINLCINQTFSNKNKLQLLLAEAAAKKSFDFATVKSCTKYLKIPCAHAMAVLRSKHGNEYGMSICEYSLPLYKVEAYLLAYMDSINVVPLESKWCVPEELLSVKILPPLVDTKLGRKRRKRVKGISENFKSKRRSKCSICKKTGHKRTTCVNNNKS
ncbi:hypothetical protein H5410_042915 [Solanum commersonii]|uniref:MuDRA-like transposase n=1 Tax=Solanum commersonii TaxID=4109 RepID=A0A9J5XW24_SOLCO|nr:hypothetical protein H5410_042915 [Solanum commersonii]